MELRKVPVAKCVIPDTRVTAVYDEEQAELLRKTKEQLGILQPLVVTEDGDQFLVVDGKHRLEEALRDGDQEVDAVVYKGDGQEALLMNLVLNKVRGKVRASDMIRVIASLTEDYGMDSDAIQQRTGLPRDYIEKLWRISGASVSVRQALDDGVLSVGSAFEISRLPALIQQDEMVAKMGVYHMTVKDTKEFVDNVLAEMAKPNESGRRTTDPLPLELPKCQGCGKSTESRYLQPVALCPNCYGDVWRQHHEGAKGEGKQSEQDGKAE